MTIIDYYKNKIDYEIVNYYNGLKEDLSILEEHVNTLYIDRKYAEECLNSSQCNPQERRMAKYCIGALTSKSTKDIFEEQISKILGITNIDTKHGWDGNDEINNEPYEYKPTSNIRNNNYLTANVSIRDDNIDIINHKRNKGGFNNYEANFVIVIIDKNTSEFVCIYKFKESILYKDRIEKEIAARGRNVKRWCYSTNINTCIEFSEEHSEKYYKWHNLKFF